ncbi:MAG: Hsp70 family protein, partial [Bacillota bacterium]
PRGVPQIEVKFDIDVNGIVHVSAKDLGTGKEQSITITGGSGLSEQEIERMVKDAEQYAEQDRKRKEEAEARNQADSAIYQAEKAIRDFGGKADQGQVDRLKRAVEELKNALQGKDIDLIKRKTEELTKPLYEMTASMYQQQAAQGQQGQAQGGGPAKDEKVVDADYEVKDDNK